MRKNILVTGGAGFIGANFVRYALKNRPEDRVVVLDRLTYAGNLENLKGLEGGRFLFIRGDIGDFNLVDEILKRERIGLIVHFAAESHVDRSILGPKAFIETNVLGTFTLLEAARKNWGAGGGGGTEKERRFIHVSTDEVYGTLGETGYFTEESPYKPNSPYAATKASSDHLVRSYFHTYSLPVITTNCSNNFGPYQFPEKLIPLTTINALMGKDLPLYGDGRNVRDWIYVEDHCSAVNAVIEKGRPGETYNIGARVERENIEVVRQICSIIDGLAGKDARFRERYPFKGGVGGGSRSELIRFVKDRPGHDRRYAIDPSKTEAELSWRPAGTFEENLLKTVRWYVENSAWWERVLTGEYLKYYEAQYGGRTARLAATRALPASPEAPASPRGVPAKKTAVNKRGKRRA